MLRPLPQVPQGYSPGDLETVNMVDRYPQLSDSSDSSNSPDSLYSSGSPTVPMIDTAHRDEVEEHDEEEYERLLDNANPFADPSSPYNPEAAWTPSPKDSPPRKVSIISNASPRGSISGRGDSLLKAALILQQRGASTPSIRDSADGRRRSSTKSITSSARRRSSALSSSMNGSFLDPLEEAQMRSIAAMDLLSRRFSEVVEVSHDDAYGDTYFARDRLQSRWSESSISSLEETELRTASYGPTPELHGNQGLISNYPLASVAETTTIELSSATLSIADILSHRPSPAIPPHLIQPASSVAILTPPAPPQPSTMWRERSRPLFQRKATTQEYQFPPRLPPAGTARPKLLNRSISAPFFGSSEKYRPNPEALALHAAGTFTMARAVPLGTTPLRASTRRESIMSILSDVSMYSRRSSMVVERTPAGETMDRRFSTDSSADKAASRRDSENHRNSIAPNHHPGLPSRRDSSNSSLFFASGLRKSSGVDLRRESLGRESLDCRASLATHKSSIDLPVSLKIRRGASATRNHQDSRRSSEDRRMSLASSRKSSTDRRISLSSRKSSVVSFGEYRYLASQIAVVSIGGRKRSIPALTISLPPRTGSWSMDGPSSDGQTPMPTRPKYDRMTTFFGQAMVTPERLIDLMDTEAYVTPKGELGRKSVLDRPRPVGHPEYVNYRALPKRSVSSKAIARQDTPILAFDNRSVFVAGAAESVAPIKSILNTGGVSRKPVPTINLDREDISVRAEIYHQARRRGAMERFDEDTVDPLEMPPQRDPLSILKRSSSLTMVPTYTNSAERPVFKRHKTGISLQGGRHSPTEEVSKAGRQGSGNHFVRFFKW